MRADTTETYCLSDFEKTDVFVRRAPPRRAVPPPPRTPARVIPARVPSRTDVATVLRSLDD